MPATLPQTACQKALRPHEFSRNPNPAQTKAPSDLRVCAASVADREPGSKISDKQVQGCRAFGAFGFSGFGFKHSGVDRLALGSNGYFTWNRGIWIWSRPALVDSVTSKLGNQQREIQREIRTGHVLIAAVGPERIQGLQWTQMQLPRQRQ